MKDSSFGVCPICGDYSYCRDVRRYHWFCCDEHKKRWCFGWNLFSACRDQTEAEADATWEEIEDYEDIGIKAAFQHPRAQHEVYNDDEANGRNAAPLSNLPRIADMPRCPVCSQLRSDDRGRSHWFNVEGISFPVCNPTCRDWVIEAANSGIDEDRAAVLRIKACAHDWLAMDAMLQRFRAVIGVSG